MRINNQIFIHINNKNTNRMLIKLKMKKLIFRIPNKKNLNRNSLNKIGQYKKKFKKLKNQIILRNLQRNPCKKYQYKNNL